MKIYSTGALLGALVVGLGGCSEPLGGGAIIGQATRPQALVDVEERRQQRTAETVAPGAQRQILFGDLHTHTSFSPDGYILGLPVTGGEGARPPADACDYARFCSALDFWGISDHAEGITPRRWSETRESIRQCNAIA